MKLIPPPRLNEDSFEALIAQVPGLEKEDEVTVDLTTLQFVDPYGMVGLLELAHYLASRSTFPSLLPPASEDVVKYLERLDFFKFAPGLYNLSRHWPVPSDRFFRKRESDVLLEITPVEGSLDVHDIVVKVKRRAGRILSEHLNYDRDDIDKFLVAVSEVCQNIPEHSESAGWIGIQKYFYEKRLGKNVVKIAVMDLGIGIRKSLGRRGWSDKMAIEKALFEGVSRHKDLGRGHGLTSVKGLVQAWGGKIAIRSGTAKVGLFPNWAAERLKGELPHFPGTQISIVLPQLPPESPPSGNPGGNRHQASMECNDGVAMTRR